MKCGNVCSLNTDCCTQNGFIYCDTNNHDYPGVTPPDTEAICHEWCCEEDEYHCGDTCVPLVDGAPDNGDIVEGTEPNGE